MSSTPNPVTPGENVINTREAIARIGYLTLLEEETWSEMLDQESWAEEIEELAQLRKLVEEVGEEAQSGVRLILDSYWKQHADSDANELFDLNETGAAEYFDYKKFARMYQMDYTSVEFGGYTYWFQA